MSFVGLKDWMIARIDPQTKQVVTDDAQGGLKTNCNIPGVFRVDLNSSGGATKADLSNLQGSITKTYGSNAVARASAGTPEPSVSLGANGIPFEVMQKITGMVKDENGAFTRMTDAESNHCALLIHANDWDGNDAYVGFYDGAVTMGNTNIDTNTNSDKISADALTYTALGVGSEVGQPSTSGVTNTVTSGGIIKTVTTGNGVKVYSFWNTGYTGFDYDKMIKTIFVQASDTSNSQSSTVTGTATSTSTSDSSK